MSKSSLNKQKTMSTASSSAGVCKKYNDSRGCSREDCKFAHVCDFQIGSSICGKAHNRAGHNANRDGKPTPR